MPGRNFPFGLGSSTWAVSVRLVGLSAQEVRVTRAANSWFASAGTRTRALFPGAT
jgi:hypothetical protein